MKKLSKVICLVLSALMLLSLAACGKQGDGTGNTQGKPIEGGTFVYAIEEPITSLNWYNNSSTDLGKQVFQNLYDPMWKSNTDGSLDYRLAKSVDISEDGTTYTLTLRDDIFWSDGEKITTDDIVFTLDTLTVPEVAPSTATAYKVDGEFCTYEKQSDTVIVFKVGRASNLFKKALGALYILPAHCFEGVPATEVLTCEQNANIATSGAFVVDSFNVGEKLVCLKNPNYYRTAAHIDGFEVRCVSDASTQEIAFRNKELSIFTISNAETLANYKDNDEYQVVSYPDGRITFMEINPNSEAMSTMEARQAVIYALDLDALVYGTYGDEALCRTATSILSTVSMFYNPEITNYKQDLDKAAQLIEQTGLKDKTIKIIYNSARVGQEELATMIKSQLDAAGLNAQIDSMETAAYFKSYFYATDSYDIALMGNGMLDDPSGFVGLFAHTRSGANMYTTDEVDNMWKQLDREMDPAVRQDIMNQALQALKDCWSCVPVLDTNYVCAAQKNIGGFEASDRLTDLTQIYYTGKPRRCVSICVDQFTPKLHSHGGMRRTHEKILSDQTGAGPAGDPAGIRLFLCAGVSGPRRPRRPVPDAGDDRRGVRAAENGAGLQRSGHRAVWPVAGEGPPRGLRRLHQQPHRRVAPHQGQAPGYRGAHGRLHRLFPAGIYPTGNAGGLL